jgi:hypothetical protein
MSNYRAVGRVAEPRGSNCRIEVFSFKHKGTLVTNRSEIKMQFKPYGYVYAPRFFERFIFKEHDLIEFTPIINPSHKGDLDNVYMDLNKGCKAAGLRVFHLPKKVMFDDRSFIQPSLKQYITEEVSHFYIRINVFLYGPFKSTINDVVPKSGTFVNKFNSTTGEFQYNGTQIILFEPDEIIDQVDCMTSQQLVQYVKDQIRNQQLDIDLNQLRKALDSEDLQGLEITRVQRLLHSINAISLSNEEIRAVFSISKEFKKLYESAIDQISEEIKEELISPFENESKQLQQAVTTLTATVKKLKKEEDSVKGRLENLQKESSFLSSEKDRLIEDIKAHSLVHSVNVKKDKLLTYEEQVFLNISKPYDKLESFINKVIDSILPNQNSRSKYVYEILYQFKYFKCFLCPDVRIPLQIARLSNNCKVILQQVEPDWLKFENLFSNGLSYVWRSAHENPENLYFFILEDLNMASIECYGRPLLDLASGIRKKLPTTDLPWPDNLWVFGAPIHHWVENNFGLPLIEKTFNDWGAFPIVDNISFNSEVNSENYLQLVQIKEHTTIIAIEKSKYFIQK